MAIKQKYSMSLGMELLFSGVRRILGGIIDNFPLLSWSDDSKIIILHLDKVAEKMDIHNLSQLINHCSDISFKAEKDVALISFKL